MNQDPVEQYPEYYTETAYRSTHIPIMPADSESEHGPDFVGNHMTYQRLPWSKGSDQFFPEGSVESQFNNLLLEGDTRGLDYYNQERFLIYTTNRLARIVGLIWFVSKMFQLGTFVGIFISLIMMMNSGYGGLIHGLGFTLWFFCPFVFLKFISEKFVEKKSTCL